MSGAARIARALECPACGAEIDRASVIESQQIASCRKCQKVIDLALPRGSGALAAPALASPAPPLAAPEPAPASRAHRQRVPLPRGMSGEEAPGRLTLIWDPSAGRVKQLAAAVPGMLFAVAYVLINSRIGEAYAQGVLGAMGVIAAYAIAAALVNRVRIVAADKALQVSVGPLPWPGNRATRRGEVLQLFAEVDQEPDRNGDAVARRYVLSAVLGPEGRRVQLVKDLETPEQALWLEDALERALGLRHTPVGGELTPAPAPPAAAPR